MTTEGEEQQKTSVELVPGPVDESKIAADSAKKCVDSLLFYLTCEFVSQAFKDSLRH